MDLDLADKFVERFEDFWRRGPVENFGDRIEQVIALQKSWDGLTSAQQLWAASQAFEAFGAGFRHFGQVGVEMAELLSVADMLGPTLRVRAKKGGEL